MEGNKSICYKKAACDLTPGPCCSPQSLSARTGESHRPTVRKRRGGNLMEWWVEGWKNKEGEMPRKREITAVKEAGDRAHTHTHT